METQMKIKSINFSKNEITTIKNKKYNNLSDLKKFVIRSMVQQPLEGVHYNNNGDAIVCNGKLLLILKDYNKDESLNGKTINPKTGNVISDKYPNYKCVIPENSISINLDANDLSGFFNYIDKSEKEFVSFKTPLGENVALNASEANKILSVLKSRGAKEINMQIGKSDSGVRFISDNGDEALLMPNVFPEKEKLYEKDINLTKKDIDKSIKNTLSNDKREKHYVNKSKNLHDKYMKGVYEGFAENERKKRKIIVEKLKKLK